MRVLHINTSDLSGGAARAAYRTHRGLLELGVSSRMLVAHKSSDDPSIFQPDLSRRLDLRVRRQIRRRLLSIQQRTIDLSRQPGSELFSAARSAYLGCWDMPLQGASLINLHWTASFLDPSSFFAAVPKGKPLVWTLHDINPLTGGCHYAGPCERFTDHCGFCPQLGSTRERDISHKGFGVKSEAYRRLDHRGTAIVASCRSVAAQARRSALLGHLRIEQIPLGLDLSIFRPHDREACRKAMNIQQKDRVVLFICQTLKNRRKGLDLLLSAVEAIEPKSTLVLMSVGSGMLPQIDGIRSLNLGVIESDRLLSLIYNVADVFAIPSREENLALTALEATACGCPVVGFSIGGLPDIIEDGRTGYLAAPFEIRQLRDAIEAAIRGRDNLSPACRLRAETLFSLETHAKAYQCLYSEMLKPSA